MAEVPTPRTPQMPAEMVAAITVQQLKAPRKAMSSNASIAQNAPLQICKKLNFGDYCSTTEGTSKGNVI